MTGRTVWLASYPKSGNTWLRAVLDAARSGADVDLGELVGAAVPASRELLEDLLGIPTTDLTSADVSALRSAADELYDAAAPPGPVLRKVHDGLFPGPGGEPVVSVTAARAALYVVRDPRDVAVSFAHHTGMSLAAATALVCTRAAALAADPHRPWHQVPQRIGSWTEHVRSWVDQTGLPVHVIRYEDALADPVGTFGPAVRFAGIDVDHHQLTRAVHRASFERLSRQERERGFPERPTVARVFFRQGTAGGWRTELPDALADKIVETHRDTMTRFGYLTGPQARSAPSWPTRAQSAADDPSQPEES